MFAAIVILMQVLGSALSNLMNASPPGESAPAQCCCCPAGACQCGCETPAAPAKPGDEWPRNKSGICTCDNVPLGLLDAPGYVIGRLANAVVISTTQVSSATPAAGVITIGNWPHGPPPDIPLLATVILLN